MRKNMQKNMSLAIISLLLTSLDSSLFATKAVGSPLCFIVDKSGRMTDLSTMCGSSASTRQEPPTVTALTVDGRYIKVGNSGKRIFFLDTKESSDKRFQLNVLTEDGKGLISFDYAYACAERRVFLEKASYFKNGKFSEAAPKSEEQNFQTGSAVEVAMNTMCKRVGSPGY
jgi:hypothetical protein